jgi:hypothetical protein
MTQEDKDLLLKDLCARLPYGVKVLCLRDFNHEWYNLEMVDIGDNEVYVTTYEPYANRYVEIEAVKPYLFPLSSMTEEQEKEWRYTLSSDGNITYETVGWLNAHHFDYHGLIEKGLAIDATRLKIY